MKKRKLRKPRPLYDIARCWVSKDGYRYIRTSYAAAELYISRNADKIAKWFTEAAAWVREGDK